MRFERERVANKSSDPVFNRTAGWCGLGENFSVRKFNEEAVHPSIITTDDPTGSDLGDAVCKLVVLTHSVPPREAQASCLRRDFVQPSLAAPQEHRGEGHVRDITLHEIRGSYCWRIQVRG